MQFFLYNAIYTQLLFIERRDYGGVLSEDCEDNEQSSLKVSKVRETVLRTRNCQTRPKLSHIETVRIARKKINEFIPYTKNKTMTQYF